MKKTTVDQLYVGMRVCFHEMKNEAGTVVKLHTDGQGYADIVWDNHKVDALFFASSLTPLEDPFITWTKKVRSDEI